MIELTRTELRWLIGELDKSAFQAAEEVDKYEGGLKRLAQLRADNLQGLSEKLHQIITSNAKRIIID